MANFPTPPTYALPLEEDKTTKQVVFSPAWIRWFIDVAKILTSAGFTLDGKIDHGQLANLQGGNAVDQYFHLTEAAFNYLNRQYLDGIILRDTGATPNYWRITIDETGSLHTENLGATPP